MYEAAWRGSCPLRTVSLIFFSLIITVTFYLLLADMRVLNFNVIVLPAVRPAYLNAPGADRNLADNPGTPRARNLPNNPASPGDSSIAAPDAPAAGGCSEGLRGMLNGYWEPKPMTAKDVERMNDFHKRVREEGHHMPEGMQREDLKCGNFTIAKGFFRALCDPAGPTPCCYGNTCVNRTVEDCACPDCFDMRAGRHAEYATWRTTNPSCQPLNFTQQTMCDLLDGGTIYTIGDSFVRHVHTAILLMIRNNDDSGAFGDNTPLDVQKQCRNLYVFTEKVCRHHLAMNVKACEGKVHVRHILGNYNSDGRKIFSEIAKLKNKPRSVVYVGLGMHEHFATEATFNSVMKPVVETMTREHWKWPIILWASTHSIGMLKSPMFNHQSNPSIERFNREMEDKLSPYMHSAPVYVYNAFNLTAGVTSFDGSHYGIGVNKVKVNILMNFIESLKEKNLW